MRRTIAVPCAGVVAHPTLPTFTVTVVTGAAAVAAVAAAGDGEAAAGVAVAVGAGAGAGCFVVQFAGADAAPVRCWGTPGGAPQAVLYPPNAGGGVVVVTHDRRLVAAGWPAVTSSHDGGGGGDDVPLAAEDGITAAARVRGPGVTGGALRAFDGQLAPHKGTLKVDGAANASGVGANAKAGGGVPWGDLFDAPSHALPPLTTLAPHFLDALLDHQSIAPGAGGR